MDYSLPRLYTRFGERAFSHAGPATCNALTHNIRTVADPVTFRKLLKSHYFSALEVDNFMRYINLLTYLLTYLPAMLLISVGYFRVLPCISDFGA